jgi:hypothetical protein
MKLIALFFGLCIVFVALAVFEQPNNGKGSHWSSLLHNAKVRIVCFLYPSALIELRQHDEKLVVVILFNNGSGDGGANATTASVADSQDAD